MGLNSMMILLSVSLATAADVTLYQVLPTSNTPIISQQVSVSAIGVDSGGSTTYVGQVIENLVVYTDATTTTTINSVPTTFTYTLVENQSGAHYSYSDAMGVGVEACVFGADGKGSCTGEVKGADTTIRYSTTGAVVPYVTLKSPGLGAVAAPNAAGALRLASPVAIICLSIVYLLS